MPTSDQWSTLDMISSSDDLQSDYDDAENDEMSSLCGSEGQARGKLFKFLMLNCKHLMPKWIFNSARNTSPHFSTGSHPYISHNGRIDKGGFGDVHRVSST
jgi:hypothetical protein